MHDPIGPTLVGSPRESALRSFEGGIEGRFEGGSEDGPPILDPFVRLPLAGAGRTGEGRRGPAGPPGRARLAGAAVLAVVLGAALHLGALANGWLGMSGGADEPVAAASPAPGLVVAGQVDPRRERDRRAGPGGTVPRQTTIEVLGAVTLVSVGVTETSLAIALAEQREAAAAEGQRLLITTTRGGCEPCEGFVTSLPDPLMQEALAKMRVIRVDIDVFGDDLDALRLRRDTLPGFFLVGADLAPSDAIHGGEWGEDIATNIAPVLGPFVRGQLRKRKHAWPLVDSGGLRDDPPRSGGIWL